MGMMSKMVKLGLCSALSACLFANPANARINLGDQLQVYVFFPDLHVETDRSASVFYSGPGQTLTYANGYGIVTLYDDKVVFSTASCGGCSWRDGNYNGPYLLNYSNTSSFTDWTVLKDTAGISYFDAYRSYVTISWQGTQWGSGQEVVVGLAPVPVPEPASWAMMIGGFGLAGAHLRRRKPVIAFA